MDAGGGGAPGSSFVRKLNLGRVHAVGRLPGGSDRRVHDGVSDFLLNHI